MIISNLIIIDFNVYIVGNHAYIFILKYDKIIDNTSGIFNTNSLLYNKYLRY